MAFFWWVKGVNCFGGTKAACSSTLENCRQNWMLLKLILDTGMTLPGSQKQGV